MVNIRRQSHTAMKKKKIDASTRARIIAEYFGELDQHRLPASIAVLTRTKQSTPSESCFGGVFVGTKDTSWPHCHSRPMKGVLQIRTKDLPYCPPQLEKIALIQLFCVCEYSDKGLPVRPDFNEDDWFVVRTFESLRGLRPIDRLSPSQIKPCRIEWIKVANEIPSYPDDIDLIDDDKKEKFRELEDWEKLESEAYSEHWQTKVGGWPVSCQSGLNRKGYAIQIGSEEKANFMWGDDGVAVLYYHRKKWSLEWDCF